MLRRTSIALIAAIGLAALPVLAQTATPAGNAPPPELTEVTTALDNEPEAYDGLVYFDDFVNTGSLSLNYGVVRYPQWGESAFAGGQLCDEVPQGDFFDTLPLPLRVGDYYAEIVATAFNDVDTSVGFAVGDFATEAYDLLFLMNDFQGVWRTERWFYPRTPGLEQRSSARADVPHWIAGEPMRIGLEVVGEAYTLYLDRDGAMTPVFEDSFTPEGNQIALAIWGSMDGPRRVCFDSVMVRGSR